jgi:TRAP transporter 4TM/12TM fusion protein
MLTKHATKPPTPTAEPLATDGEGLGLRSAAIGGLALTLTGLIIYTTALGQYRPEIQYTVPLLLGGLLIVLRYPSGTGLIAAAWDIAVAAMAIFSTLYILLFADEIIERLGRTTTLDLMAALAGTVMVLEIARRTSGPALSLIALVFLFYGVQGRLFPGVFSHPGLSLERELRYVWLSSEGVFGIALTSTVDFIFIFILFGALLERTGGGRFFTDIALAIAGRFRSGPALTAVLGSSLMGTVNGSSVANVASTGTITIPLMKRVGYDRALAGAIEATASTGGQIMPPVMGVAAFLIAQNIGVPYAQIALAAALPAILYFLSIAFFIHFKAVQANLRPLAPSERPRALATLAGGWFYIVPLAVIFYTLFRGYSVGLVGLYGVTATLLVGMMSPENRDPRRFVQSVIHGCCASLQVVAACACVGIIVAIVGATGLGGKLAELVVAVSGHSLALALVISMIASLIFGMGLPTVACYILLAVVVAPSIIALGTTTMSAHFFIFYFGALANITPPMALASFAAAAIAGASIWRTSWLALVVAIPGFLIPFICVYEPALLLQGTAVETLQTFTSALVGCIALAMATAGFGVTAVTVAERILLGAGAALLVVPDTMSDGAGSVLLACLLAVQLFRRRAAALEARRVNNAL